MNKTPILIICISIFWSSCSSATPSATIAQPPAAPPTTTNNPAAAALWIDPAAPAALREIAKSWNVSLTVDAQLASHKLEINPAAESTAIWVYALAAPFPTLVDGISSEELRSAWHGDTSGPFGGRPLLMDESTLDVFTALWDEPASGAVTTMSSDQLITQAWADMPSWAIIPFEELQPRWKVLTVDHQSPIHNDFEAMAYPLTVRFALTQIRPSNISSIDLPASNRDPQKLTAIILTGVTALVRGTALTMELKGITYPGRDIGDTMRAADIAHISNEVPFYSGCAYPNFYETSLSRMCSSPRYVDLLTDIGTDVVELTGNHFNNAGESGMLETLKIYKDHGIPYYGGGADLREALTPLLLEHHGNKIAFIGCKRPDNDNDPSATAESPGAAPCDFNILTQKISELHSKGYVVIFTFQWYESYDAIPHPFQYNDFRLAADAGASIVSGSQAHYAQVMEFHKDSFIHYGLGNMFFDQMEDTTELRNPAGEMVRVAVPGIRRLFHDRYVIYDGRYISTELLTSMLEDYARPRPMTPMERPGFLQEYFNLSGWTSYAPTPTPQPTVTLTPIRLPEPAATPTP